jgi:hypothetical protein
VMSGGSVVRDWVVTVGLRDQMVTRFPGLSKTQARNLVRRVRARLNEAESLLLLELEDQNGVLACVNAADVVFVGASPEA